MPLIKIIAILLACAAAGAACAGGAATVGGGGTTTIIVVVVVCCLFNFGRYSTVLIQLGDVIDLCSHKFTFEKWTSNSLIHPICVIDISFGH